MDGSINPPRQGIFRLQSLPPEIRRRIYGIAVTSVPPIELRINYGCGGTPHGPWILRFVKAYTLHDLRMLATSREFREETTKALYAKNTFDIPLF